MTDPIVRVLGVRHHGPGSARAVLAALEELQPDAVLIEGPADADPIAALAASEAMVPPVALLAYAVDHPGLSAFWPMATFSPEWQALRWATSRGVPVRFCDLPAAQVLAARPTRPDGLLADESDPEPTDSELTPDNGPPDAEPPDAAPGDVTNLEADPDEGAGPPLDPAQVLRTDPIAVLAHTAGYDDPERWWDDLVESPSAEPNGSETISQTDVFDAIREAMAELRRDPLSATVTQNGLDPIEARREAQMRQVLRATIKAGAGRVAVVCGAWHAPALTWPLPPAAPDQRLLRGQPKRKVALTWVPWTHSRLSYASGYGAGIASPGWYAHLFSSREHPIADWLTRVAGVLRAADHPASSAHVIEAVRLAETLAVLRGRPLAGLAEVNDATRAVICDGNDARLDLVMRALVVGEALGEVPAETPTVPLESDLLATSRRLRLKRDPLPAVRDLDLRRSLDLQRSALLHRLQLLGIGWGRPTDSDVRNIGTFRETWQLAWRPELAVDVIEASLWGTTIASAATTKVISDALAADLPGLTVLVERCLLAGLGEALPDLLAALDTRAARDHDATHLMRALPPLVRARRYGDVRGTDLSALDVVTEALLIRICTSLPTAVTALDDDGADRLRADLDEVHAAVALRGDPESQQRWLQALASLISRADVHGLLVGRMVRLLLDAGELTTDQAGARLARALSVGSEPAAKAAWVEGFLAGSGLLLVHDADLLRLLDDWVRELSGDDFEQVVPLLRRTFGEFEAGERRAVGEQVRRLRGRGERPSEPSGPSWDADRAHPAIARAALILGLTSEAQPTGLRRGGAPVTSNTADDRRAGGSGRDVTGTSAPEQGSE